jgi:hypothetical protein
MARKKEKKKEYTFSVEQEVIRTGVVPQSFDFMLRFTDTATQPELFMDELVELVLKGLIERYGQIVVKINWWAEGLTVIAPNGIPEPNQTYDALQGTSEGTRATIDSEPSPSMES